MQKTRYIPKVAVITRTKNRPHFLERSVKSVLNQTVDDFVHVILNDGGYKTEVEEVLTKYPDDRRIVLHNKNSVGLAAALNQAIKACKSEYICILDDDDSWSSDRLALGIDVSDRQGVYASVVPMEIVIEDIDANGSIVEIDRKPHPESWSGEISLFKQAHRNFLSNGAIMYRREVYDELGGYDETLPTAEDWDFGIRLMLRWDVEQVVSDQALVYYHQRPEVKAIMIGNSVHANVRDQERAIMLIRNRYLRNDLQKGVIGIGYIMNDIEQNLINVVRLEAHINRASDEVTNTIIKTVTKKVREFSIEKRIVRKIKGIINRQ